MPRQRARGVVRALDGALRLQQVLRSSLNVLRRWFVWLVENALGFFLSASAWFHSRLFRTGGAILW